MLTAAVLCPGLSLPIVTPAADLTIGVNRAVLAHRCDWWSAMDIETIAEVEPIGRPNLFTIHATRSRAKVFALEDRLAGYLTLYFEDVADPPRFNIGWSVYSATAAYALAYHLGARRITVYGADMIGTGEYDGHAPDRAIRTSERWATERAIVAKLDQWLKANGAELVFNGAAE